ncbi:MAG: hypothetical protein Q3M24_13740 [Candidatus Electrothrix aestuarii]|uniref:Uncharacterized protein n=1 Tax=Candidatus Electrothrix aestuarii TaxID=3062594 RepID=A0AAU8LQ86_9BACT|nr:hypothetical protein [Candidatus Electrothrix aestuarii]
MKNNKTVSQQFSLSFYTLSETQQPRIKVSLTGNNGDVAAQKNVSGQERKNIFALGSH